MPRNYLKEETLLFKRFRTFSPLHIFSFKNCFDRVARWKNTCFFHRAAISTANTTRTRIRRLMEGSAPARRCSFPRWCTVPVACCSKTPETGLHGDTVFAVLPPRARDCAQTSLTVFLMDRQKSAWISGNLVVLSRWKPVSWDLFFVIVGGSSRIFHLDIVLLIQEMSNVGKFGRFRKQLVGIENFNLTYRRLTQLLLIDITINRVISKMLIFQV